jgi:uncharacterized membrane protein
MNPALTVVGPVIAERTTWVPFGMPWAVAVILSVDAEMARPVPTVTFGVVIQPPSAFGNAAAGATTVGDRTVVVTLNENVDPSYPATAFWAVSRCFFTVLSRACFVATA